MKGTIKTILPPDSLGRKKGYILGEDNNSYYFDSRYLMEKLSMEDFHEKDEVDFGPSTHPYDSSKLCAKQVVLIKKTDNITGNNLAIESQEGERDATVNKLVNNSEEDDTGSLLQYYNCGFSKSLSQNKQQTFEKYLKTDSNEVEVLERLSKLLYISYINQYDMGHNNLFPFCLIGATKVLKQYIRGKYEFLLVFSHFDTSDWQQNSIKAAKFIRQRRDIVDRRPLVNFFILISNARKLKQEIDRMKGGTDAVIIPFSFEEIMSCCDTDNLRVLLLSRFDEYYFENNMLDETGAIEEEALLFGDRGKIADSIVQRCKEKKFSGIFGLRRSGKSSVLRAVMRRLDIANIPYVRIEARDDIMPVDWKTALYDIATMIRERAQAEENKTESEYEKRAVKCFKEDIKVYTQRFDIFVIAIDEVERITYNSTTSNNWRNLEAYEFFWAALRDCGCPLIICGVNSTINEKDQISYNGQSCDNPMYGRIINCSNSDKTYLPPFSDEQTKYMLNELGDYSNVGFDNVYSEINNSFGGQPYAIRQFSAFMFNQLKDRRQKNEKYQFQKPAFKNLNADFCASQKGKNLFYTILQHIESYYKDEYVTLIKIAFNPQKRKILSEEDKQHIDHLVKYGLIDYDRTSDYISFKISALQQYIIETEEKRPEDMDNDERRKYIQERIVICERKLKAYVRDFYIRNGDEDSGRKILIGQGIQANNQHKPILDPQKCKYDELFEHKKFILFFSKLQWIIENNWNPLGNAFKNKGMDINQFHTSMRDLNAGRTDADHYDPEDGTYPNDWLIDDSTLMSFKVAFDRFDHIFQALHL